MQASAFVTSPKRISFLPSVPTVAESGLPGFDMVSWYGLWGPANLPKELSAKLSAEVAKVVRSKLSINSEQRLFPNFD